MRPPKSLARILLLAAAVASGTGCSALQPSCPTTLEELRSADAHPAIEDDAWLAAGTIQRFVDADDPEYRGFDVNLEERVRGFRDLSVAAVFVRADAETRLATGDKVLLIGRLGEEPQLVVAAGDCPVLTPLQ